MIRSARPDLPCRRPTLAGRLERAVILLLMVLASGPATAQAPGALGVSPTNVLFDGRTRSVEITLINRGTEPATYRIGFQNLRQLDGGEYQTVERPEDLKPDEKPAEPMLRYSPRQVTIDPGKPQTIRLMLRKPASLAVGEYRSHLLFQQLPPRDSGESIEPSPGDEKIAIRMLPLFGVSIPVIVREGDTRASAALTAMRIADADPKTIDERHLEFRITRDGNASVRGDFEALYIPAAGGEPVPVGKLNGVSVLYPNAGRIVRMRMTVPEGVTLSAGKLLLNCRASGDGDQQPLLASAELALP
jgi:hypothetical protein